MSLYPDAPLYTALYDRRHMPDPLARVGHSHQLHRPVAFARRKQQLTFPFTRWRSSSSTCAATTWYSATRAALPRRDHRAGDDARLLLPDADALRLALSPVCRAREPRAAPRVCRWPLPDLPAPVGSPGGRPGRSFHRHIGRSASANRQVYRREATIIYPPVDVGRFAPSNRVDDYYLFVGRLVPYRRLDLLIEAFNKMGRPLVIAGSGRDRARLEALAGPTVTFAGFVPDADLPDLLARCRAFMWPGEEDFGIRRCKPMLPGGRSSPLTPGARETVITGRLVPATGALFAEQSVAGIIEAVESFDPLSVSPAAARRHAEQFDIAVFKRRIDDFVTQKYEEWNPSTLESYPPPLGARVDPGRHRPAGGAGDVPARAACL